MATTPKSYQFDGVKGADIEYGTFTVTPGAIGSTTGVISPATFFIGSTPQNIGTSVGLVNIANVQTPFAAVAAGTALPAGTIPQNTFGIFLISVNTSGAIVVTAGAANFTTGYATLAAAIAALPATPASQAAIGYIVVNPTSGTFIDATTSLAAAGVNVTYNPYAAQSAEANFNPDTSSPTCSAGDQIFVQPRNLEAGLIMKAAQVSGANTVQVTLKNLSPYPVTGAQQTYDYKLLRYLS